MLRAIELNGVAVDANKLAFSLGRLAAADPAAAERAAARAAPAAAPQDESLDALIERAARYLAAYQNAAYARALSRARVAAVRAREQALVGADAALPLTRAVGAAAAQADGLQGRVRSRRASTPTASSRKALAEQFEGDDCSSSSTWRRRLLVQAEGRRPGAEEVRFGAVDAAGC